MHNNVLSRAKEIIMRKAIRTTFRVGIVCVIACAVVHRRVIAAMVKGDPLPEPPAWHKGHPCVK